MFRPKKTIPKLAVAALALTGCGSSDGGNGGGTGGTAGSGGSGGDGDFANSLSAFCMSVASCWGYTAQECTFYYNQVNDSNDSPQCTAALISYFDCGAGKNCDQVLGGACDTEYYAVWDDGVCNEI